MKFKEKRFLLVDDNPNGYHEMPVDTFLIGEKPIFKWESDCNECGFEMSWLYPAYIRGKRAWMIYTEWNAQGQYHGGGEGEYTISFKRGVNLLLKLGAYSHMFPKIKRR